MKRYAFVVITLLAWVAAPPKAQTTPDWPSAPGFENIPRNAGALVAAPFATSDGRAAIMAWHNGVLFTVPEQPSSAPGSNFQVRMWHLGDSENPRIIARAPATDRGAGLGWSLGTTPQPINAHGYFHVGQNFGTGSAGNWLVLGSDWPPEAPWSFRAQAGIAGVTREASGHLGAGTRGSLFAPWHVDETWWSYGAVAGLASIRLGGPSWNPGSQLLAEWDHLGDTGVIGHPFLLGNLLIFASDQSRTGVATYDISDPTQPVLLDVLKTGGPGGYWPELWGHDGELYLVFPYNDNGNGMRVVDATDPSQLRFVGDTPLSRPNGSSGAMYAQFQDEFGFIGDHKIDMRTRQSVLAFPSISNNVDIGQFALPLGNLLVAGGTGSAQGIAVFAHQAEPDTRPPSVAFHIPRAGQSNYPTSAPISLLIHETLDTLSIQVGTSLVLRQVLGSEQHGSPLPGTWTFSFDDVLTFQPTAPLATGASYEMRIEGIRDAAGNAMPAYSFHFSTGEELSGNHAPVVTDLTATPYPAAVGQTIDFSASASDADGDNVQFRYDFGDGSNKTVWSPDGSATHAYSAEGHYRAILQVRDASGVISARSQTVTVASPPPSTPSQSSSIACAAASRRVYAVNPDHDSVSVLDADSTNLLAEHAVCRDPRSVAALGTSLWIACHDDDRVLVIDAQTGNSLADIDTGYGSAPIAVAIDPAGNQAFVSLAGRRELRRYATATRLQTGVLSLASSPRALAIRSDGQRVFVSRFRSPRHHGEVYEVNAANMDLITTHRIPKFGNDANRDTTASGRGVINSLVGLAASPRSGRLLVVGNKPNSERGLLIHPSQDLDTDNTVRNLLVELDPSVADSNSRVRHAIDLDNSDSASAVAFSPLGDYALVTLQGNNELLVLDALALDAATGLGAQVTRLPTGLAPQGLCVDAISERSFVQNFTGRSVTVIETASLFRNGDIAPAQHHQVSVSNEPLGSVAMRGKRVFYNAGDRRMSAEGYLSCATCHLDGGDDGRVWDFTGRGEGLRNTTALLGGAGTLLGNVHWSGNFDEIQDFEIDIRNAFGGTGFLDDADFAASAAPLGTTKAGLSEDLDALAAYLGTLDRGHLPRSPHRLPDGSYSDAARDGELLFAREGCSSCHVPPHYTDSSLGVATLHDVGTVRDTSGSRLGTSLPGVDTPGLRGLFATAPYLHDGSAQTLFDVFRYSRAQRLPAELGIRSGGASLIADYVDLNNDDSVRGRAYVSLDAAAQRLQFDAVDGGKGGIGAIELRYSNSGARSVQIRVNGVALPLVNVASTGNAPSWRVTHWENVRIEGVPLLAGSSNSIQIETDNWFLALDEIAVARADDLDASSPHRRVVALPQAEQEALIAFLLQLDGSPTPLEVIQLFTNGFE